MPPHVRHRVRSRGGRDPGAGVEQTVPDRGRSQFIAPDAGDVHEIGEPEDRVDGQFARSAGRRVRPAVAEPERVHVAADAALFVHAAQDGRVVGVEFAVRRPLVADVERGDELHEVQQRHVGEEVRPVLLVVVDDRARVRVGVRVAEEVLQILHATVRPVVGDHPVRHVEVFRQRLVPEIERRDEVVPAVVRVDVIVPRIPALRGHVDPALEPHVDVRPLAGAHVHRAHDGLVLEAPPHLQFGRPHREGDGEVPVRVEVVVLGPAQDAGKAAVGEVAPPVRRLQVDAGGDPPPARVADADLHLARGLRPRVVLDPHRDRLAASTTRRVEPEPHPAVGRPFLAVQAAVPRVDEALPVRRPRGEVLVRAGVREAHLLDARTGTVLRRARPVRRDLVDVVVTGCVRDVGHGAAVRGDDGRGLVVRLDADEEFRLAGVRAPPPQRARAERRLAALGDEDDVARVADPVAGHVVRPRVGDDGLQRSRPQVVRPEVERPVPSGREQDPGAVGGEARPHVDGGIFRQPPGFSALEVEQEDVEIEVDVRGVGDVTAVRRPARHRVVSGAGGELPSHAPFGRNRPDPPLVGEGDRRAIGREGGIGGRRRDRGRKVALHVHLPRPADPAHRRIPAGKRPRIPLRILPREGRGSEPAAGDQKESEQSKGARHRRHVSLRNGRARIRSPTLASVCGCRQTTPGRSLMRHQTAHSRTGR